MAELADATVSKTVGDHTPCRFEPGLRHQTQASARLVYPLLVPSGVRVAHGTLDPLIEVRILARQPTFLHRSRVAQSVERAAVNRLVVGSSPAPGASLVAQRTPFLSLNISRGL